MVPEHFMNIAAPVEVELEDPTVEVGRWHDQNIDVLAAPQEHLYDEEKDHFIQRNGVEFAGTHLLLDLYGASQLDNIEQIEQAMRDIVSACGATLLHIHLHHFSPSGGVSGVAVLAESHISVHTWPERDYAGIKTGLFPSTYRSLRRTSWPSKQMKTYSETLYDSYGQEFAVDKVYFENKTDHQHLIIFENAKFGRVMALDGIIQTTEADEDRRRPDAAGGRDRRPAQHPLDHL